MERSDASVTEKVESVEIIELLSAPSNVSFDNPLQVTYVKLNLTAQIIAEPVDETFLSSQTQKFSGTTTDSEIEGVFEIYTEKFSGPGDAYPLSEPQAYLLPEANIESDDPVIREQAEEITQGCTDSWEASQKVAQWVYENIVYKITGEGAKKTLETKQGDCGPHTYLTVALLRSIGIPSRIVGGVVYGRVGGSPLFIQHYWTEVLIGGEWIPFDSTAGQYGYVDATHVRLFKLGAVQSLEVEVLEYTEEEPEIRIEERKALLEVGEYYKYRFVINDVEFGYHEYSITKEEPYEGQEAYYVELLLDLDFNKIDVPRKAVIDAVLYITDEVIPLYYHMDALVNAEKQTIECTFSEGKAHDVVTVGEEKYEEVVTLEDNTYLMGNNMIGLWALVYRTLQLKVGETYKVPLFFSENFTNLVVDIEVLRTETIVVAGESYEVFVCNVPLFKEVDYVTKDGLLVKIDLPSQNGFIELVESSARFFLI
jgi:transglutaminase-like putative cysteine protease